MKRLILEIVLGVLAIVFFLAYVGANNTVKKSHQVVAQWRGEMDRLNAQIQRLEADLETAKSTSPDTIAALQEQLNACRDEKTQLLLVQPEFDS